MPWYPAEESDDEREERLKPSVPAPGIAPHQPQPEEHPDDAAVDAFAALMKAKMEKQRAKGYGGWETCPVERLQSMLFAHIAKGDPVDVANFAMMLSARGEATIYEDQYVFDLTGKWPTQPQPEPQGAAEKAVGELKEPTTQTEWDRVYNLIRYWAGRARTAEAELASNDRNKGQK